MGGKKKAAKKSKKGGDDDGEIDQSALNEILTAKVAALKAKLVLEQERRDNAESNIDSIRQEGTVMNGDMDKHKTETRQIVSNMTTIYKSMERAYNVRIDEHEAEVAKQEQLKKKLNEEINQLKQDKEDMMKRKEAEIFRLKERIDTMSSDFASMLKTTLKKMQERIDDANQTYEGDQPGLAPQSYGGA